MSACTSLEEFNPVEHQVDSQKTRLAIARLTAKETEQRVSSSAFSSRVSVTDCRWVPTRLAASTFLLCGLSNGCVCLLNVNNLSKLYLFEDDADTAGPASRDGRGGRAAPPVHHQQVSVDCAAPFPASDASRESGRMIVCVAIDGAVRSGVLDTTSVVELKKLQKSAGDKVLAYPIARDGSSLHSTLVRFCPSGGRCFVLAEYKGAEGSSPWHYSLAVLRRKEHGPAPPGMAVEHTWSSLCGGGAPRPRDSACLRHLGWWDDRSLLGVWSDGVVRLYRISGGGVQLAGAARIFEGSRSANAITAATATLAVAPADQPSQAGQPPHSGASVSGLITVVMGANVVTAFNLTVTEGHEPAAKRVRQEPSSGGASVALFSLVLRPTQQSFFSEDIPVRSLSLVHVFSWVVAAILESGAVIFLDAQTMRLMSHRPIKRLLADSDEEALGLNDEATGGPTRVAGNQKTLRCFTTDRPFNFAVVEHNTIVLLKSM